MSATTACQSCQWALLATLDAPDLDTGDLPVAPLPGQLRTGTVAAGVEIGKAALDVYAPAWFIEYELAEKRPFRTLRHTTRRQPSNDDVAWFRQWRSFGHRAPARLRRVPSIAYAAVEPHALAARKFLGYHATTRSPDLGERGVGLRDHQSEYQACQGAAAEHCAHDQRPGH